MCGRRWRVLGAVTAVLLGAVACGNGGEEAATATSAPTPTAVEPTTSPSTAREPDERVLPRDLIVTVTIHDEQRRGLTCEPSGPTEAVQAGVGVVLRDETDCDRIAC